jgi:hypothetical protein
MRIVMRGWYPSQLRSGTSLAYANAKRFWQERLLHAFGKPPDKSIL